MVVGNGGATEVVLILGVVVRRDILVLSLEKGRQMLDSSKVTMRGILGIRVEMVVRIRVSLREWKTRRVLEGLRMMVRVIEGSGGKGRRGRAFR